MEIGIDSFAAILPDPSTGQQFEAMASPEGAFLIDDPATVAAKMLHASEVLGGV